MGIDELRSDGSVRRAARLTIRLRGIYQGQGITFIRELHGYGVYFATFEILAQRYRQRHGKAMPASAAAGYGAISGLTLWAAIYPIEYVA